MLKNKPILYIIGGANGVGKTTSFYDQFPKDCPFINADEISKKLKEKIFDDRNIQELANREAIHQMNKFIFMKQSFGFESNLVDVDTWKFIERIQILGYEVNLIYYGVDDVNICIQRVKQRVKEGGHDVREDIIKQRYNQSLLLLKHYLKIPDILVFRDNSSTVNDCLILKAGLILQSKDDLPNWVQNCFNFEEIKTQKSNDLSIGEIKELYKNK